MIGTIAWAIGTKDSQEAMLHEAEATVNPALSFTPIIETTVNAALDSTILDDQTSTQTSMPVQEEKTEAITQKAPSVEDVERFGDEITYPKSSSYLSAYETMYVKSDKGDSIYVYWKSKRTDEYRRKNYYIQEKAEVVVLAREKGSSCILFTDEDGNQRIGWVNSSKLVYDY